MFTALRTLLVKLFGGSIARLLSGAGLSVLTFAAIKVTVVAGLAAIVTNATNLGSITLNIMLMAGFGDALSIIGAALLTRAAIKAGTLGVTKTA